MTTVTPWYKTTLRWGQTNLVECDPERYDPEFWRAHWQATRIQGVIVNAGGIVAYYPSRFELHHRAEKLGGRDLYGEIVAAARDEGLAVIARMDSNRVSHEFADAHPDWLCRDIKGAPYTVGDKFITCVNSGYYRDYLPAVMEEIIERSGPDGFADNSWAGLPRRKICHCNECRQQFRDAVGSDLPRVQDWDDPIYRRWIGWNFQRRNELWAHNNRATRRAGGETCAWMGMISGDLLYNSERFIDLQGILTQTPIVMLDHQRRNHLDGFQQNTEAGKRLHEIAGWDVLIPESTPQYQLGAPVFRLSSMPEPEMRLWATAGFAGGIQPWWHHIGASHEDRRQYRTAEPLFRWHEENEHLLVDRTICPDVGVVWSQQNHDLFGREDAAMRTMAPYRGAIKALDRHAIPYVPVHADDIAPIADRVRVLILPNIGAMSDAQLQQVQHFAEKGGSVIATGETGSVDMDGMPRDGGIMHALFGLTRGEGSVGSTGPISPNIEIYDRHSYLRLSPEIRAGVYGPRDDTAPTPRARDAIFAGLEMTDTLPFGGFIPTMTADPDVEVLATYIPEFPIFPPETSWMRQTHSDIPALTVKDHPTGGRMIWLVADVDRCFARDETPDLGLIIANAVRAALSDDGKVTVTGGHGMVTAELYSQSGRYILHLNNRLMLSGVPGRQHDLLPIGPIEVRLRLDASAHQAQLRVAGTTSPIHRADGDLVIQIPSVSDHEVVVIDR